MICQFYKTWELIRVEKNETEIFTFLKNHTALSEKINCLRIEFKPFPPFEHLSIGVKTRNRHIYCEIINRGQEDSESYPKSYIFQSTYDEFPPGVDGVCSLDSVKKFFNEIYNDSIGNTFLDNYLCHSVFCVDKNQAYQRVYEVMHLLYKVDESVREVFIKLVLEKNSDIQNVLYAARFISLGSRSENSPFLALPKEILLLIAIAIAPKTSLLPQNAYKFAAIYLNPKK